MKIRKEIIKTFAIILLTANIVFCEELPDSTSGKYPDYACMFLGEDKCETLNRKVFNFNNKLNKYIIKPADILWASIMPKYGMDRIRGIYKNIEYPKRMVSSLIQKDFKSTGKETIRFLTNSTLGLGGMFDPAKRFLKIESIDENMEQALAKCKCNQGKYMVVPVINGCTPRSLCGQVLDAALNPTCYIGSPILALIKLGFTINETTYMQPIIEIIQSNYIDSYDIAKKMYGLENYIKAKNYDRENSLKGQEINDNDYKEEYANKNSDTKNVTNDKNIDDEKIAYADLLKEGVTKESYILKHSTPKADITLEEYNPQTPVIDSMRTALFNLPGISDSIWTELSIWNRSFAHRIKNMTIQTYNERAPYKFRYILQKHKKVSPLVIIYPSIGEGIQSNHSVVFAKLFYDLGYSVVIQGSSFHWEFVNSMPKGYTPGIPSKDAEELGKITGKIISKLENKYKYNFNNRIILGTSFGALTALFLAEKEAKVDRLRINKFISINPPIELLYAMKEVDKNGEEWKQNPNNLKDRVAVTAAKIINLYNNPDKINNKIINLPFNDYEAKLITGFIMHQKLSDLIFSMENIPTNKKSDFYKEINNINYNDYLKKYILKNDILAYDDLNYDTSLYSISDYLETHDNYLIYHTLNDYLVNTQQLNMLKKYTGNKSIIMNNGAHLGYMYREEFINSLRQKVALE